MKILIGQPKLEQHITQLENEIRNNPEVDAIIYPEGYLNQNVDQACNLAKRYNKIIITGHKQPKDRAIIIDQTGNVVLDKAKYDPLLTVQLQGVNIGHLLCDELVIQGLGEWDSNVLDIVAHPIGVGMFSDEQFEEWVCEAAKLAKIHQTIIIGTSHADGSYRSSEISIPIAYCVDRNGEAVFIRKNDTRTIILDTDTMSFEVSNVAGAD